MIVNLESIISLFWHLECNKIWNQYVTIISDIPRDIKISEKV